LVEKGGAMKRNRIEIRIPKDLFTCRKCGRHFRFKEECDVCENDAPHMLAPAGGRGRISLPGVISLHNRTAVVIRIQGPVDDKRFEEGVVSAFQYVLRLEDSNEQIVLYSDQLALVTPSYAPVKANTRSSGRIIGAATPPRRVDPERIASSLLEIFNEPAKEPAGKENSRESDFWTDEDDDDAIDINC